MPRLANEQHQFGAQRPNAFTARAIGIVHQQQPAAGAYHARMAQSNAGASLSLVDRRFYGAGLAAAPVYPGVGVLNIVAADEAKSKCGVTETQSFGAHYIGDPLDRFR